jgi:pimeloyl-ACP methyl ester carboxylesterase
MSERRTFHHSGPDGVELDGLLDLPERLLPSPCPTVVVCHGFKGFMEWGFFPALAELLADRGFVVVRFNFSGAGVRPGEDRVSDLDAFRADTYSRELAELRAIIEGLEEITAGHCDRLRFGLLGHSRGGAIALLAAAEPELAPEVRALVTWSAIARLDRWSAGEKEAWRRDGELLVANSRTGQRLPLGVGLLDDVERNGVALDPVTAARRRTAPWLIVHGGEDESVPVAEGRRLAAAGGEGSDLEVIEGSGHTFGAGHPFDHPTPHLIAALNATQIWFRRHLIE